MKLKLQKKLASDILECSEKKIWFDEERLEELKEAITKRDIRVLIQKGVIAQKQDKEISRGRARKNQKKKSRGQRKGLGSRKGKKTARTKTKEEWMNKIRSQREIIKKLRASGKISPKDYRTLYKKAKSGFFRNKRHLKLFIEEHEFVKKGNEIKNALKTDAKTEKQETKQKKAPIEKKPAKKTSKSKTESKK